MVWILTPTSSATSATDRPRLIRASRRWLPKPGLRGNGQSFPYWLWQHTNGVYVRQAGVINIGRRFTCASSNSLIPKTTHLLPQKWTSSSKSLFVHGPVGRLTISHYRCRTTESRHRSSKGNSSTRYEGVSKANVLGEISAALMGAFTIVQGSDRLHNAIPLSF